MKVGLLALALLVSMAAGGGPQSRPGGTGDAKAHFDRATALHEKGDLDGAIAEYREAIRLNPHLAGVRYLAGFYLEAKGEKQAALAAYREASELDSRNKKFRAAYKQLSKELKK